MLRSTAKLDAYHQWLESPPSFDLIPLPVRLLLDLLPQEVQVRIASFLSRGAQTSHLLALARTNPMQRRAVLSALHHRLVLPSVGTRTLARWVDVFLHDVRELVCERGCLRHLSRGLEPHPVSLCQMSTLRKVTLFDETDVLDAISNSASIKHVVLIMRGQAEASAILKMLRSLNLRSFELVCERCGFCRFQPLFKLQGEEDSIPACCPNLRILNLRCQPRANNNSVAADLLWRSLPCMRKLQEVTLCAEPPDDLLPLLDELGAVQLDYVPHVTPASSLVRRLAPMLTVFRTDECFMQQHSRALAMCARLEELATRLERGSESALGQAIRAMEGLRKLALEWKPVGDEPCLVDVGWGRGRFSDAKDGVPLILDNTHRLEELTMRRVSIPVGDVVSILCGIGGRLKVFELDVFGQEEEPLERLKALLEAVAMHCPGLRQLTVVSDDALGRVRLDLSEKDGDSVLLELQKPQAVRALQLVRRRVPLLDVSNVEQFLHRCEPEAIGRSPDLAQDIVDSDNDAV